MYNFWFAIEDSAIATSFQKGFKRLFEGKVNPEVNINWFKAASKPRRPFANLTSTFRKGQPDALFYATDRVVFPTTSLMRRVPTLISLDTAPLASFTANSPTPSQNNSIHQPHGFFRPERLTKNSEAIQLAGGLVVWSEWARRELIKIYGIPAQKIAVVRSGIDLESWDAALVAFQATQPQHTPLPERVRLLFLGSDFATLGGDLLLKVLDSDPELANRYELHLVLTHTAATNLGATIKRRNVHLHTYPQSHGEAAELYLNADIFVLPSHRATNPALLATALAAGLPIIASRVEGLTELVKAGQNGLLIEPNSASALAAAINTLINDPEQREAFGKASREIAQAEFNPTANTQHILSFLKHITVHAHQQIESQLSPRLLNNFNALS